MHDVIWLHEVSSAMLPLFRSYIASFKSIGSQQLVSESCQRNCQGASDSPLRMHAWQPFVHTPTTWLLLHATLHRLPSSSSICFCTALLVQKIVLLLRTMSKDV